MIAQLITAPLVEPVDLASAKLHLRVDSTDDDDLIESLITTAREYVEDITRRKCLTQTWDYCLQAWPTGNYFKLPFGNLQSVTSVKWKDDAGTESTLVVTTDYLVETNGEQCGRIVLPYAQTWPSGTLYPSNPITTRFVCGWTEAALMPSRIKSAILLVLAKLYESRGEDTVALTVHEDETMQRLLPSMRLWDF